LEQIKEKNQCDCQIQWTKIKESLSQKLANRHKPIAHGHSGDLVSSCSLHVTLKIRPKNSTSPQELREYKPYFNSQNQLCGTKRGWKK